MCDSCWSTKTNLMSTDKNNHSLWLYMCAESRYSWAATAQKERKGEDKQQSRWPTTTDPHDGLCVGLMSSVGNQILFSNLLSGDKLLWVWAVCVNEMIEWTSVARRVTRPDSNVSLFLKVPYQGSKTKSSRPRPVLSLSDENISDPTKTSHTGKENLPFKSKKHWTRPGS